MSGWKSKLSYDSTDANTLAASDAVGAIVKTNAGDHITSTLASGKQAMDVYVANAIAVDVVHTSDSVRLGDGTSFLTSTTVGADIGLDVYILNASLTVSASDLDVRDLTHVSDSVRLGDGSSYLTSTTVGADIGLDVNIINSAISVNDAALANTAGANGATSVDNTAGGTALVGSPLANRKYLMLYNHGSKEVYLGFGTVTTANGFPLGKGVGMEMRLGAAQAIKAIAPDASAQSIRYLEAS